MSTPSMAAMAATKSGRAAIPSCWPRTTTRASRRRAAMSTSSMHGRDHDGGERRLRQLLEQPGQEEQGHDRERGDDQAGDLALGAGAAVDGGLREAAVDDHPAREARPRGWRPRGRGARRWHRSRSDAAWRTSWRRRGPLQSRSARCRPSSRQARGTPSQACPGSPSEGRPPSMCPTMSTPCWSRSNA